MRAIIQHGWNRLYTNCCSATILQGKNMGLAYTLIPLISSSDVVVYQNSKIVSFFWMSASLMKRKWYPFVDILEFREAIKEEIYELIKENKTRVSRKKNTWVNSLLALQRHYFEWFRDVYIEELCINALRSLITSFTLLNEIPVEHHKQDVIKRTIKLYLMKYS